MTAVLNMESADLSPCYADPNFAIICGFFEKFGKMCGIEFPLASELVELLDCEEGVPEALASLHVQLLRKIRKSTTIEKWERTSLKFCRLYLPDDADVFDARGYLGCPLDLKLRLLRTLLETQFDLNPKFKAAVNLLTAEELRHKPIGRDSSGRLYWGLLDGGANLKVFREDIEAEDWTVVAKDRDTLVKLLHELSGDSSMDLAPIVEPHAPVVDTGQDSTESEDDGEENGALSEGTTEEDDDEEEEVLKANVKVSQEQNGVSKATDDEDDEVSEAIEEPVMMVEGEGSGNECEAGLGNLFECSEAIEEDVFYVSGVGSGQDCDTGNPKKEPNSEQEKEDIVQSSSTPVDADLAIQCDENKLGEVSNIETGPLKVDPQSIDVKPADAQIEAKVVEENEKPKVWSIQDICSPTSEEPVSKPVEALNDDPDKKLDLTEENAVDSETKCEGTESTGNKDENNDNTHDPTSEISAKDSAEKKSADDTSKALDENNLLPSENDHSEPKKDDSPRELEKTKESETVLNEKENGVEVEEKSAETSCSQPTVETKKEPNVPVPAEVLTDRKENEVVSKAEPPALELNTLAPSERNAVPETCVTIKVDSEEADETKTPLQEKDESEKSPSLTEETFENPGCSTDLGGCQTKFSLTVPSIIITPTTPESFINDSPCSSASNESKIDLAETKQQDYDEKKTEEAKSQQVQPPSVSEDSSVNLESTRSLEKGTELDIKPAEEEVVEKDNSLASLPVGKKIEDALQEPALDKKQTGLENSVKTEPSLKVNSVAFVEAKTNDEVNNTEIDVTHSIKEIPSEEIKKSVDGVESTPKLVSISSEVKLESVETKPVDEPGKKVENGKDTKVESEVLVPTDGKRLDTLLGDKSLSSPIEETRPEDKLEPSDTSLSNDVEKIEAKESPDDLNPKGAETIAEEIKEGATPKEIVDTSANDSTLAKATTGADEITQVESSEETIGASEVDKTAESKNESTQEKNADESANSDVLAKATETRNADESKDETPKEIADTSAIDSALAKAVSEETTAKENSEEPTGASDTALAKAASEETTHKENSKEPTGATNSDLAKAEETAANSPKGKGRKKGAGKNVGAAKTRSLRSRSRSGAEADGGEKTDDPLLCSAEGEKPSSEEEISKTSAEEKATAVTVEDNDPLATPTSPKKPGDEDPLALADNLDASNSSAKKKGRPKGSKKGKKKPEAKKIDEASEDVKSDGEDSKDKKEASKTEEKTPKKSYNNVIGDREIKRLGMSADSMDSLGSVRASRRIAQIRMKEDAEREERDKQALEGFKKGKKSGGEDKKKKGKGKKDDDYKADESEDEDGSDERKQKKEKKFKFNDRNPWLSSSGEEEEEAEPEEDEIEEEPEPVYKSDHEFSPESDLEDPEYQPIRVARTAHNKKKDPAQEKYDDVCCEFCKTSDRPEYILLCDDCDKGCHTDCLKPPLHLVPEGEWFCPPCSLLRLVTGLKKTLRDYDRCAKQRENEELRKKRLAFVGISLDNVLPAKKAKKPDKEKHAEESGSESESGSGSKSRSGSGSASDSDGPVYQLRERRSNISSYRYNEYDEMIRSAIRDEIGETPQVQPPEEEPTAVDEENSKEAMPKKDSEDEESGKEKEKDSEEEEELPEEIPAVVPRKRQPKKKRKLNSLELSSDDDDHNSDSDFKGSSSEEDEEEEEGSESDYSGENRKRRKGGGRAAVRRSERARMRRIEKDFIDDDSSDVSDIPTPPARNYGSSESSDSDRSWGRPKGKKGGRRRAASPPPRRKKNQKKDRKYPDSSEEEKPKKKKKRVTYGLDSDVESKVVNRRTRGKQINFNVDNEASDSESDVVSKKKKKKGKDSESEESDVEFDAEDEKLEEEEEEIDQGNEDSEEEESSEEEVPVAKKPKTEKKVSPKAPIAKRKGGNKKSPVKKKKKAAFSATESESEDDLDDLDDEAEEKLMDMLDKGDIPVKELKAAVKRTKEEQKDKECVVEKKKSKVKITPTRAEIAERQAQNKAAKKDGAGGLLLKTLQSEPVKPVEDSQPGTGLSPARQGRPAFPTPVQGPFIRPPQQQLMQPSPLQMMSALGPQPPGPSLRPGNPQMPMQHGGLAPHPQMMGHQPPMMPPHRLQMPPQQPMPHGQGMPGMHPQNRHPSMGPQHHPGMHPQMHGGHPNMPAMHPGMPMQPNAPFPHAQMQQNPPGVRPPMGQPPGGMGNQHRPQMPPHSGPLPPQSQQQSGMPGGALQQIGIPGGPHQPPGMPTGPHQGMPGAPHLQPMNSMTPQHPQQPPGPQHLPLSGAGNQGMPIGGQGQFPPQGPYSSPTNYPNPSSSPSFQSSPESQKPRRKPGPKPGSKNKKKTEEEVPTGAAKKGRGKKGDDVTIATVQAPTQFPDANPPEGGSVITRMLNSTQGALPVPESSSQQPAPPSSSPAFGPPRTLGPSPSGGGAVVTSKPPFPPESFPPYQNFQQPFPGYPNSSYPNQQAPPGPTPNVPQPVDPALAGKTFEEEEASEFGGLASYFASQAEEELN